MNPQPSRRNNHKKRGQMLVLFCLMVPVFFGTAGLSIDSGLTYRTAAMLSRGVDATALRLVNNYQQTVAFRQGVAMNLMQKNVPEFMNGANVGTWSDSNGNTGSGANYGSTGSQGGETMSITSNDTIPAGYQNAGKPMSSLNMKTRIDTDTGVMTVTLTATVTHENFFMQLFGKKFRYFQFTNTATVNRYPAVNILILDNSGSMYTNGGSQGIKGSGTTTGAAMLFINEFDETRDYLMIVTFSYRAQVLWPTAPTFKDSYNIPYFGPSRNFISGFTASDGTSVPGVESVIQQKMTFDGATNGPEALRYAAENVQKWLDNNISGDAQSLMRINYVFMTDGQFNTIRGYLAGPGFGFPITSSGNTSGATPTTVSRLSVHNTFHDYAPLVGDCIGTSEGVSTWAGSSFTYDKLFGSYFAGSGGSPAGNAVDAAAAKMPGINTLYGFASGAALTVSTSPKAWIPTYASASPTTGTTNSLWQTVLLAPKVSTYKSGTFYQPMSLYTSSTTVSGTYAGYEQSKWNSNFRRMGFPTQIVDPIQNPARGTNFYVSNTTGWLATTSGSLPGTITRYGQSYVWLPQEYYTNYQTYNSNSLISSNTSCLTLSDTAIDAFPGGSIFFNHAGTGNTSASYYAAPYGLSSANFPWLIWLNSSSVAESRTVRVTDYYPDYTFIGDATTRNSSPNATNVTDTSRWSFKQGKWISSNSTTETSEAYWMAQAQAYILRHKDATANSGMDVHGNSTGKPSGQNATFYIVKYGSADSTYDTYLKDMSNCVDSQYYDSTQNVGQFYNASQGSLQQTFQQIAQQIAVRISK
jgi:Flp pilus assembly protein TadG